MVVIGEVRTTFGSRDRRPRQVLSLQTGSLLDKNHMHLNLLNVVPVSLQQVSTAWMRRR